MAKRGCRKATFPTEEAALDGLARVQERALTDIRYALPTGVYRCPSCRKYHLTSKSPKPIRNGRPGRQKLRRR